MRTAVRLLAALILLLAAACVTPAGPPDPPAAAELRISAIPDQDPQLLARLYGELSGYLGERTGIPVRYVPVTDYTAAVTAFRRGDLDAVFFGGLTGVQARGQVPGSVVLAQRDIDERFRSVFVANAAAGLAPVADVPGLSAVAGHSLTFGSEVSTSGRLMPQFFLDQAGVTDAALTGPPGFSGSHDATIKLVTAGTYQVGALSASVWDARVAAGQVDRAAVTEIFRTPEFHDYHWLARPDIDARVGAGATDRLRTALLQLDGSDQRSKEIMALFTATSFVPSDPQNYADIEQVGRRLGLLR
jgi:phosphonate transport system substrate-binding protein